MKELIGRIKFIHVLSTFVILGTFAFFFVYCFSALTDEQRQASKEIVIALITAQGMILSYHAGSTAGSQHKTDTITALQASQSPQVSVGTAQNISTHAQGSDSSVVTENQGSNAGEA